MPVNAVKVSPERLTSCKIEMLSWRLQTQLQIESLISLHRESKIQPPTRERGFGMPTAKRTGLGLVAFAFLGVLIAGLSPPHRSGAVAAKSYTFAVSGWSQLHLIELGTDWPTKTRNPDDRLMFCRHVLRLADFEVGANCAPEATTIADASPGI